MVRLSDIGWQHDNARAHDKNEVKQFFYRKNVKLIAQSPYSPDLNLCDRFLNNTIKNELRSRVFITSEEVKAADIECFRNIDQSVLRNKVDKLMDHRDKVIQCNGDYVTLF